MTSNITTKRGPTKGDGACVFEISIVSDGEDLRRTLRFFSPRKLTEINITTFKSGPTIALLKTMTALRYKKYKRLKIHVYLESLFYFVCGVWPIFHIESFMAVTGLKTDVWLVKAVGLLLTAIAISLFTAAKTNSINFPVMLIGTLSPLALLVIDITYVFNNTISKIYLWDGFLQVILIVGWLLLYKRN